MAGKIVNEFDFREFIRCPLRISGDGLFPESQELTVASRTAAWLLKEAFGDRLPTLGDVRSSFEEFWGEELEEPCPRPLLRAVPRIAKRLHDLATDYIVLHPNTPYSLSFGRIAVKGAYSTLVRPKKPEHPVLLRLRCGLRRADARKQGPDAVNMLRWFHFRQWESGRPLVRVLNYAIDDEASWLEFYEEREVRSFLNHAAANLAEQRAYPNPGPHCQGCPSEACMSAVEDFPNG